MTNPYRAMLAEMAAELDWSQQLLMDNRTATHPLADRARVLIAQQPEPEGLTQIALQMLGTIESMGLVIPEITDTIRKALEQGHPTPQPVALFDIGQEWRPCVKLPTTVHGRDQRPGETHSSTREGITPLRSDDLIMRGVRGEEYPIGRDLFEQTYELLPTPEATNG